MLDLASDILVTPLTITTGKSNAISLEGYASAMIAVQAGGSACTVIIEVTNVSGGTYASTDYTAVTVSANTVKNLRINEVANNFARLSVSSGTPAAVVAVQGNAKSAPVGGTKSVYIS